MIFGGGEVNFTVLALAAVRNLIIELLQILEYLLNLI